MANGNASETTLPEGTDKVVPGASMTTERETIVPQADSTTTAGSTRDKAMEKLRSGTDKLSAQAADKTRGLVDQGLVHGSEAIANVSKLVGDTAAGLDERLGAEYGDYARKAATTLEDVANKVAAKDADELIDDARDLVRKSPGIALAGAAIVGFALARLVKSGLDRDKA